MFCPNCGQKLEDNVKFCQYCGTKLEAAIPAAQEAVTDTGVTDTASEPQASAMVNPYGSQGNDQPAGSAMPAANTAIEDAAEAAESAAEAAQEIEEEAAQEIENAAAEAAGPIEVVVDDSALVAAAKGLEEAADAAGHTVDGSAQQAASNAQAQQNTSNAQAQQNTSNAQQSGATNAVGVSVAPGAKEKKTSGLGDAFNFKDENNNIQYDKLLALGSGFAGLIPLAMYIISIGFAVIGGIIGGITSFLTPLSFLTSVIAVIGLLIRIILLLVAACTLGGAIYEMVSGKAVASDGLYETIAASAVSVVYAILNLAGVVFPLQFILMLANLVLGVDLAAKLIQYGTGMTGTFNFAASVAVLKETWEQMRTQAKEEKARENAAKAKAAQSAAASMASAAAAAEAAGGSSDDGAEYSAGESYFDGEGLELFAHQVILALMSLFTCGIATPWGLVRIYRWKASHTVINGKRQKFNGTGAELLGKWIIWELLMVITCGLYSFYVSVALKQWEISHTSYEGMPDSRTVFRNSYFDGSFATYLGNTILCSLISTLTCGIALPWAQVPLLRWEYDGTVVERERYEYHGNGTDMFVIYIVNAFLTFITCGIYGAWANCNISKYVIRNVAVASIEPEVIRTR